MMKSIFILALFVFPAAAFAQSDPPVVGIEVQIEAPLYNNELGESVHDVEEKLAAFVLDTFVKKKTLGYVGWSLANGDEAHMLRLVIEEEASGLGPEIRVRFFGKIENVENDLSLQDLDQFNQLVFDVFAQKFSQDEARLATELEKRLSELMNDSFYNALSEQFLNQVPLTSMIELDEAGRRLIIPLRFAAINPEKESRLRVEFKSKQIGNPREGTMNLNLAGKGRLPHFVEDGLDCEISLFRYPAITFSSAEAVLNQWARIVDVLARENLVESELYMEEFIPALFANTSDGLVVDAPLP